MAKKTASAKPAVKKAPAKKAPAKKAAAPKKAAAKMVPAGLKRFLQTLKKEQFLAALMDVVYLKSVI